MDDFNAIVHAFTEGLRDLPTDDVARVRHFLAEYLGSSQHPVPFGGRARDFARLDAWLTERNASAYMLLAAPAGRGKSALLLRWCQQLLSRPELAVVYFPVSIRFRTNLAGVVFPALVALLARLHGESLPADPHIQEEVWRGLLHEYLTRPLPDGRLLVLVLDGVDEAADWTAGADLLPAEPPADLRVVISARYLANDQDSSAWLKRLGWTREGQARTLELFPLDRTGIASVLLQMGFPVDLLGERVDIVTELHRLSEGDPLLIRLYVDDLWERGEEVVRLQPGDLHAIRPGLVGYFERWWNDQRLLWSSDAPQREAAVQSVLNLLAGALGPLSQTDIVSLATQEAGLSSDNLERHLEPLARFVIGDGMRQGYVFSHPRLASYFLEERLSEQERQEVEKRFLTWGVQTLNALNQGDLAPEQASAYIVQYYGAHLERAGASTEALLALVSNGWRLAWEKLDRANAGFLGDGERAWRAAAREDAAATQAGQSAPYLGAEIRSLFCRTSINSMTSNISPRLMLEAVRTGVWTPAQGLACIRLITDPLPRARELVGLAPSVREPLRTDILQEALDTLTDLKDERARLDALVELAPGFSAELLAQILTNVSTIEDEADRAGMLADLAASLSSHPRLIQRALDSAQEIEEEEYLALALVGLAPYLSIEQQEIVLQLARAMQNERYRAQTLLAMIPNLSEALLQELLPDAYHLWDALWQVRLLTELARHLPERLRDEPVREALKPLGEIIDQEFRVELLVRLAPCLPEERLLPILSEVQALWDESQRASAFRELLPLWPEEHLEKFLQAVQAMKSEEQRTGVLRQLFSRLPATLLETALASVESIWDEGRRVELLALLAPLANEEIFPRLLELMQAIGDPGYRIWLLAEAEAALSSKLPTLPSDILHTFFQMKSTDEYVQTLLAIVPRLSEKALTRVFTFMLPQVFNFRWITLSDERQAEILSKLGPRLPAGWIRKVFHAVHTMSNERCQAQALVALAPRLPEDLLPDVLEIVRSMNERNRRAQVLEALISSLPEERRETRVREMLQALQVIKDEVERVTLATSFLHALTTSLPEQQAWIILDATRAMRAESHQADLLCALAVHVPAPLIGEMLHIIQQMRSEEAKARALEALAPHLPEQHLSAFLEAAETIQHKRWRAPVLANIASHVSTAGFLEILNLIYQDNLSEEEQAQILRALAPHTLPEAFPQLWHAVQRIKGPQWRAWILGSLTRVPEAFFSPVWEAIQAIEDEGWRTRALAALASTLPEQFFASLWNTNRQITDKRQRMRTISALAPSTPESFFPQLFQAALELYDDKMEEGKWRGMEGDALETLATLAPDSFFLQFWQAVGEIPDHWRQARLQVLLAARVPEPSFAQVWQTMSELEDQQHLSKMLVALAPHVPEDFLLPFWEAVEALDYPAQQFRIITMLLPRLPMEWLEGILHMAQRSPYLRERTELLRAIIPYLSEEQSLYMVNTLLPSQEDRRARSELEWEVWHSEEHVSYLVELAPRLSEEAFLELLPRLLQASQLMRTDGERANMLARVAPRAPEKMLPEIMKILWSIEMEQIQQMVLTVLLPTLTPGGWSRVLEMATAKASASSNLHFLTQILHPAGELAQPPSPALLYPALRDLLHLLAQEVRRDTLIHLAPLAATIAIIGGEMAVREACCATLETGSWWP